MKIEDYDHDRDGFVKENFEPLRVTSLLNGLLATAGEHPDYGPDAADADALIGYVHELIKWERTVLQPAVEGIIEVHRATGIDLKNWPPVLNLVQSADPSFSIEGEEEW